MILKYQLLKQVKYRFYKLDSEILDYILDSIRFKVAWYFQLSLLFAGRPKVMNNKRLRLIFNYQSTYIVNCCVNMFKKKSNPNSIIIFQPETLSYTLLFSTNKPINQIAFILIHVSHNINYHSTHAERPLRPQSRTKSFKAILINFRNPNSIKPPDQHIQGTQYA